MSEQPTSDAAAAPSPIRFGLLDRWFKPVRVPREAGHELSDLARRGSIVFVMRSARLLNFLYLAWLLRQLRLPPLRTALGLSGLVPWLARVRPGAAALEAAVVRREVTLVFLHRGNATDPFTLLAGLQRRLDHPIFLVPALLVWTRRPQKLKPTVAEILFGTPDQPSRLANAIGFLVNHRRAVLRLGRFKGVPSPAIAVPLPVPGQHPQLLVDAGAVAGRAVLSSEPRLAAAAGGLAFVVVAGRGRRVVLVLTREMATVVAGAGQAFLVVVLVAVDLRQGRERGHGCTPLSYADIQTVTSPSIECAR